MDVHRCQWISSPSNKAGTSIIGGRVCRRGRGILDLLALSVGCIRRLLALGVGGVRDLSRSSRHGLAACDLPALGVGGVGDLLPLRVGRVRNLLPGGSVRGLLRGRPGGDSRGGLGVGHCLALGIDVRLLRAYFGIGMAERM